MNLNFNDFANEARNAGLYPRQEINNYCLCLFSIVSNSCFPYNGINDSCAVVVYCESKF